LRAGFFLAMKKVYQTPGRRTISVSVRVERQRESSTFCVLMSSCLDEHCSWSMLLRARRS
jgi:hypothetical protein